MECTFFRTGNMRNGTADQVNRGGNGLLRRFNKWPAGPANKTSGRVKAYCRNFGTEGGMQFVLPGIEINERRQKMRNMMIGTLLVAVVCLMGSSSSYGQARFGVGFADGKLRSFDIAIGTREAFPPGVVWIREAGIPEDEIPVVFFISEHTGWEPRAIVRLRLGGLSWWDISDRCGLDPALYGFSYRVGPGPRFDRGYTGWHYDRPYGGRYRYSDRDIIGAVRHHSERDFHGRGRNDDHSRSHERGRGHNR